MGCAGSEEGDADVVITFDEDDHEESLPSSMPPKAKSLFNTEFERLAQDDSIIGRDLLVIIEAVISGTMDSLDGQHAAEAALGTYVVLTQLDDGARITGIRRSDTYLVYAEDRSSTSALELLAGPRTPDCIYTVECATSSEYSTVLTLRIPPESMGELRVVVHKTDDNTERTVIACAETGLDDPRAQFVPRLWQGWLQSIVKADTKSHKSHSILGVMNFESWVESGQSIAIEQGSSKVHLAPSGSANTLVEVEGIRLDPFLEMEISKQQAIQVITMLWEEAGSVQNVLFSSG